MAAMAEEAGGALARRRQGGSNKSHSGKGKGKGKKKVKVFQGTGQKVKVVGRMKKLFRKRAREYNSDDENADEEEENDDDAPAPRKKYSTGSAGHGTNFEADEMDEGLQISGDEDDDEGDENEEDEDEDGDDRAVPSITKFAEGCRAFRAAFKSIIKKPASDDVLGPILSGQQKLVAQKLAEEESDKKLKGDAKKEKLLLAEKGHVKPANYLDTHEKFLVGVATKGVVKLFNAVSKAQNAQKGLNPSSSRDAKAIKKRRKEAFFTALGKPSAGTSAKVNTTSGDGVGEAPSWAPLRDNYMLTNSKLKNWDKMQEAHVDEDVGKMSEDSSSDED